MSYQPKFYFPDFGDTAPEQLEEEFQKIMEGVYPTDILERLSRDNYNPIFIGVEHNLPLNYLELLSGAFGTLPEQLKLGIEMMPKQVSWVSDYMRDLKEYSTSGTIRGKVPSKELVDALKKYGPSLTGVSLGILSFVDQTNITITPLEHPDFHEWIDKDRIALQDEEDLEWIGMGWGNIRPAYTAIRRNIHSLGVIERERPDVIIMGIFHILKYDLLMGRDGSRTHIYNGSHFRWPTTMRMWREVHNFYRKNKSF